MRGGKKNLRLIPLGLFACLLVSIKRVTTSVPVNCRKKERLVHVLKKKKTKLSYVLLVTMRQHNKTFEIFANP